jgi:hypothetical protein
MKTTKRFDAAIIKLYNAFHNGELEYYNCEKCAVGNMCNNTKDWSLKINFLVSHYSLKELEKILLNVEHTEETLKTGYSIVELANIERLFMKSDYEKSLDIKKRQFIGLCSVIEYLCELDNIPNVKEIQSLFEIGTTKKLKEII